MEFKERYDAFARFNPEHVRRRLSTLAANLRVAGALCAAWRDGAAWGEWFGDPCTSLLDRPWSPGCNRPAPGVG
jgi:hypothetical protein